VFVKLSDSNISGLCHKSQVSDTPIADKNGEVDLKQYYTPGDTVRVLVMSVKGTRVSLGMKASYFEGDAEGSDGDSDDDDDDVAMDNVEDADADAGEDDEDVAEDDDEEDDDEDVNVEDVAVEDQDEDMIEEDNNEDGDSSDDEGEGNDDDDTRLEVNDAIDWGDDFDLGKSWGTPSTPAVEDGGNGDAEEEVGGKKKRRKRALESKVRKEEEEVKARERQLLDADAQPQTEDDFERLVAGSPNSSFLWIQFVSHLISLTEFDKARGVAERALTTITFREEQEKYNVWVAYVNLEQQYGTKESLSKVFARASQQCNPKKMYLALAKTLVLADSNEEADALFSIAAKKFKTSKKIWLAYIAFKLKLGENADAKALVQRALQSMPTRKHVNLLVKVAQTEFDVGSLENGRSMFENMLASYPKRSDVWNIYIDKEVKHGSVETARHLFKRLTHINFNQKTMQGFFKKFLRFEMDKGTAETVQEVKNQVREYMERKLEEE